MTAVVRSATFDRWFRRLKDLRARTRIVRRIEQLQQGNPGQVAPIGGGLFELKINTGPGYRVYCMQRGSTLIVLLCGGDKSTQQTDIARAHDIARAWLETQKGARP